MVAAPAMVLLGASYEGRATIGSVAVMLHVPLTGTGESGAEVELEEVPPLIPGTGSVLVVRKPEPAAILEVLLLVGNGGRTLLETPAFPVLVPVAAVFRSVAAALQRKSELVVLGSNNIPGIDLPLDIVPLLDWRRAILLKKRQQNENKNYEVRHAGKISLYNMN